MSLGSILYYVVAIFGTGLMLGLDTLVSHSYGAGDLEDAHRSLVNGVYLSLGIAPVLMGCGVVMGTPAAHVGYSAIRVERRRFRICARSTGARFHCCSILCFAATCRESIWRSR